jgi:hypothetical protein
MTKDSRQAIVDEAVRLDRQITEKKKRLAELKADLITMAVKAPDDERLATEGGGWTWVLEGEDENVAVVTLPGPSLRTAIDPSTKIGAKILDRFGPARRHCFHRRVIYAPLEDFRARVEQEFPPAQAQKLIEACEKETEPRVSFETVDRTVAK